MYVIAGVTGHTGKTVADTLLAKGQPVRVLVRKAEQGAAWKARGAEVAVAALEDEVALTQAFTGAQGAYVLLPPAPATTDYLGSRAKITEALTKAAGSAKLAHVVLLSSIGAHIAKGTGPIVALYQAERSLEKLGTGVTFVRAAYFLENYGMVLPVAKSDGVLPSFFPASFTHPVVTTTDIGRAAAQALLDGPRGRRVIELSAPQDVTPNDVAATLTRLLARPVKVAEAPLSAIVPTFQSFGVSAHMAEFYREMYAAFIEGTIGWEGKGERVRGQITVEEGLRALLG